MTGAAQAGDGAERILLIGCGDLGSRVAARLQRPGHAIWALRRRPPGDHPAGDHPPGTTPLHWLAGDVTRPDGLPPLPRDITRLLYILSPGGRDAAAYQAVFADGLQRVLSRLDTQALRRIVFVSSTAVYGEHAGAWVDETTPPAPLGMNGRILLQTEDWLRAQQRLPATSVRLAGLYGPGRLQLVERLRQGLARVPREQPHWANRIHVDDAAAAVAHLCLADAAAQVYVGVDDTPLPLDVLYDHIALLAGAARPPAGPPPAGVGSKRLSNARLRASGFVPRWPDARAGYAALLASADTA